MIKSVRYNEGIDRKKGSGRPMALDKQQIAYLKQKIIDDPKKAALNFKKMFWQI